MLYPYRSFSVLIVSPLLSTVARLCCTGTVVPAYFRPSATSSYLYLYRYICTGICRSLTVALDVNFPCMILTRTRPFRCVEQSRSTSERSSACLHVVYMCYLPLSNPSGLELRAGRAGAVSTVELARDVDATTCIHSVRRYM